MYTERVYHKEFAHSMTRSPKVRRLEAQQSDGVSSGPEASRVETQEERCVSSEPQVEGRQEQEFPLPGGG